MDQTPPDLRDSRSPHPIAAAVARAIGARPEELRLLLPAVLCAFTLFGGYAISKPLRDAVAAGLGKENVAWLQTGTFAGMLVATAITGWLVSRLGWRRFVVTAHLVWALGALLFAAWFSFDVKAESRPLDATFFISVSVFNLLSLSIFWSTLTDIFSSDRARALFPPVAVGLTAGMIGGSSLVRAFAKDLAPGTFLFVSAGLLSISAICAAYLVRFTPARATRRTPGGSLSDAIEGIRLAFRSPYLSLLALYILLYALTSTLVWMQQVGILNAAFSHLEKPEARAASAEVTASIDLYTNLFTVGLQLFVGGRIIRRIGMPAALVLTPLTTLGALAALVLQPSVGLLVVVQVLRRGLHFAIDRPAREVLYTVVSPPERYKSKSFVDTFSYRFGDVVGGWTEILASKLLTGTAALLGAYALLCAIAGAVGVQLGRTLEKREARPSDSGDAATDGADDQRGASSSASSASAP